MRFYRGWVPPVRAGSRPLCAPKVDDGFPLEAIWLRLAIVAGDYGPRLEALIGARVMRYRFLAMAGASCLLASPCFADQPKPIRIEMQVGQTRQLTVVAAHRPDCTTSNGRSVDITKAPSLGRLSLREDAPVVVGISLSKTCLGAHITGIAVDYTATSLGTDAFTFDGVFSNGRSHYDVVVISR